MVQIRRKEPNTVNNYPFCCLSIYLLHFWLVKVSNITKSPQSSMYFNLLFSNQLPYNKSGLSLSNTEILCEEHFQSVNFLSLLFASLMTGPFNTWQHPLKMELKYILIRRLPFCRFMHFMCKNENIPIWGKRIASLLIPDHYL